MNYIDLHVHSTFSDGTCTPTELIALAGERGLSHIALTDHDSVNGIPEGLKASQHSSVTLIPGVELSSEHNKRDIHIVGLGIDYQNEDFISHLKQFQKDRTDRNIKMCRKLADAGFDISYDEIIADDPDAVITRCHIAKQLAKKGYVTQLWDAFNKYIGDDCPYFVPREKFTPSQAVSLIKKAGGTAVLAHPLLYHMTHEELCALLDDLKDAGLDAIEAIYSSNHHGDESYVRTLATKYHLAISGGSDFHGKNKPNIALGTGKGNVQVPEELLAGLHLI